MKKYNVCIALMAICLIVYVAIFYKITIFKDFDDDTLLFYILGATITLFGYVLSCYMLWHCYIGRRIYDTLNEIDDNLNKWEDSLEEQDEIHEEQDEIRKEQDKVRKEQDKVRKELDKYESIGECIDIGQLFRVVWGILDILYIILYYVKADGDGYHNGLADVLIPVFCIGIPLVFTYAYERVEDSQENKKE